ncbi:MAG: hypothetical protein LBK94_08710 [Prevotellaceae bacterium]|jgi:hypothetical protein|nr:hypothetical protein [Prevotellaceae bacterium]
MSELANAISWGDGTSDALYVVYSGQTGNGGMMISSDPNVSVSARQKVLNLKSQGGQQLATLTVTQQAHSRAFSVGFDEGFK